MEQMIILRSHLDLKELVARVEAHLRRDERNKNNLSIMTFGDGLIINLSP